MSPEQLPVSHTCFNRLDLPPCVPWLQSLCMWPVRLCTRRGALVRRPLTQPLCARPPPPPPLTRYTDYESTRKKLLQAMLNCDGFDGVD